MVTFPIPRWRHELQKFNSHSLNKSIGCNKKKSTINKLRKVGAREVLKSPIVIVVVVEDFF